jgi:1-acyl-sn-glycerol-3-phosphate acyltransferase
LSAPPRERAREGFAPRPAPEGGEPLGEEQSAALSRALRGGIEGGLRASEAVAGAAVGLPRGTRRVLGRALARLEGEYHEDDWGFDEEVADAVLPLLELLYDRWWRVRVTGATNVPAHGRALLVANHAGALPWDAAMMAVALQREHPLPRHLRFLAADPAFEAPFVSVVLRKLGAAAASAANAVRLLEEEHPVVTFPEGARGSSKPYRDRYRLQRFGRGGFAEIALRTGAPIVPVAIVGSEEAHPRLGDLSWLGGVARLVGLQTFPVTPTFPWLGPLGAVPLPVKWRIEFCPPIETAPLGPEAAGDRSLVLELSERVRDAVQQALYENLARRGPAFG